MTPNTSRCTAAQEERYASQADAEAARRERELNRALRGGQRAKYETWRCPRCSGWHLMTKQKLDQLRARTSRGEGPMVRRGRGR